MAQRYTTEEKDEAVKLAEEIGVSSAARRLGIKETTLHGWRSRKKEKQVMKNEDGVPMTVEEAKAENARLKKELRQAQQDVEILQEALGFFAKSRKK